MRSSYHDWLEESRADLETARILLSAKRFSAAAFHSQQAGEEALKALLIYLRHSPWAHSLGELLDQIEEDGTIATLPQDVRDAAVRLDLHYLAARYPDAVPSGRPSRYYTESIAKEAVRCATLVVNFARQQLS